jgi:predicted O-methyltransferase YrrM
MASARDVGRLPIVAINRTRLAFEWVSTAIFRRISPAERAFRRIWPSIDAIEGLLVSPDQEHWLFRTAWSLPDGAVIVEIGSFKGRSTCCLAYGCRDTKKHVFAVDTFEGNDADFHHRDFFSQFWQNIEDRDLTVYVTPVQGRSSEVARTWDSPIHLLFIDGAHQYEDVLADFYGFLPHVVPGGIVALHDVVETWPGPLRAWNEVVKHELVDLGACTTLAYGTKPKLHERL